MPAANGDKETATPLRQDGEGKNSETVWVRAEASLSAPREN